MALVIARRIPLIGSVRSSPEMIGLDILSGIGGAAVAGVPAVGATLLAALAIDGEGGGALISSIVSNAITCEKTE